MRALARILDLYEATRRLPFESLTLTRSEGKFRLAINTDGAITSHETIDGAVNIMLFRLENDARQQRDHIRSVLSGRARR